MIQGRPWFIHRPMWIHNAHHAATSSTLREYSGAAGRGTRGYRWTERTRGKLIDRATVDPVNQAHPGGTRMDRINDGTTVRVGRGDSATDRLEVARVESAMTPVHSPAATTGSATR